MKNNNNLELQLPKRFLIGSIKFYQNNLSYMKSMTHCRFVPTCSQYAVEAIQIHGAWKGSLLACYRILRCNPLGKGGLDPVPLKEDDYE